MENTKIFKKYYSENKLTLKMQISGNSNEQYQVLL